MTVISKPRIIQSNVLYVGDERSVCGGRLSSEVNGRYKLSYKLSDYAMYGLTGIPLPYLPYTHHYSRTVYTNGEALYSNGVPTGKKAHLGSCYGTPLRPVFSWSDLTAAASRDYYARLSSHNSFNAAVSFAELAETVGTIATMATRLGLAYKHLRRGRVKDAFTMLGIDSKRKLSANDIKLAGLPTTSRKGGWTADYHRMHLESMMPRTKHKIKHFAANTWLEIQYGWKPLIYDVYGLAQFIAERQNKSTFDVAVSGSAKIGGSFNRSSDSMETNGTYLAVVKYRARLKVTSPTLQMQASLGLTNPLLVVWELVPFSFVADWFLPIGDSLQQLSSMHGYKVVDSSKTVFYRHTSDTQAKAWNNPCSASENWFELTRTVGDTPAFTWPSFNLKKALNVSHFTTALSLLVSVFHK